MPVDALRAVNGIGAKSRVPPGHMLLVPSQGPADAAAETLTNAVFTSVPQGRTFYYRVNRSDTLAGIASRYAVTVADLRRWNGLASTGMVTTGQQLRITSDLAPSAARTKRATGKRQTAVSTKPRSTKPTTVSTKATTVSTKRRRRSRRNGGSTKATTVSTKAKAKSVKPAVKNGAGAPTAKAKATAGG